MFMRKIFLILLTFIFAISCNKDSAQDWSGMEYFEFRISGKVTDVSGSPINGITVSASGSTVKTGNDGTYRLEGHGASKTSLTVSFSDMDGAENGGIYFGATRNVNLDYVEGKHGPFLGLFTKSGVDVTLVMGLTPVPDFGTTVQ